MSYNNLEYLEEYINKRNKAFESKILGTENPIPRNHFCNNQKYLDSFSQDIIHGNKFLEENGYSLWDMLYNTLVHRVLLNKKFCKENTDDHGVFYMKDHNTLCELVENTKSFNGRYRNMMQNVHLTKYSKKEFFDRVVSELMDVAINFKDSSQEEIWRDFSLKKCYQAGPFTRYQISSDLLYIDSMNITPSYIDYSNLGTYRGTYIITGSGNYDKNLIDIILEMNKNYDHKTDYTKYMIPSDANNVLCEFYKYMKSKINRYRKPEVITHKENDILIPKSIKEYGNNNG